MYFNLLRNSMVLVVMLFVCCIYPFGTVVYGAVDDPFPMYPCIENAVAFWKSVYSRYTTRQGIIHDDSNLDIIYEIVELESPRHPGAENRNQKKIKQVKHKYQTLLASLADGKTPASEEEKRVWALFGDRATRENFRKARQGVRFQLGQSDRFREGIIRSGAYLYEIKRIFNSYGLPEALAYLPHVESSFNYEAYSKFGAAGIWQFTHSTGRRYMTVDYVQDDRRDPIRASHAAAKYLKSNYEKLGSWPLAITAYNHGVNGMARAKQNAGDDFEKILNQYKSQSFGFASRNFYAEFLAAWSAAENYTSYFDDLIMHPPIKTTEIILPAYASAQTLADHFDVDIKTLRDLNPALRKPVFLGQKYIPKGYALRLPQHTDQDPLTLAAGLPKTLFDNKQKPSRFYRVQQGDTAGMIARSQGVPLRDLISANGLGPQATIYVGQNLRIPVPGETLMLAAVTETPKPIQADVPKASLEKMETEAEKGLNVAGPVPEAGETIAAETPLPLETAAEVTPTQVTAGMNPDVVIGNLQVEKITGKGAASIGVIRVEAEETLGHYADWLGIPTQSIRRLNGLRFGSPIRTGERIKIPLAVDKATFEERRYEYHKEMEEDFFAAYRIVGEYMYVVKQGDTIWTLCQQTFELPFWLIQKFNADQELNALYAGRNLKVPTVQKTVGEKNGATE